jgi:YD repeat-containing protein
MTMEEPHEIRYVKRIYQYDLAGRLISTVDDRFSPEVFGYDRFGNLVSCGAPGISPKQQAPPAPTPAPARHFCVQCGTAVQPGKKFCSQCGQKIG